MYTERETVKRICRFPSKPLVEGGTCCLDPRKKVVCVAFLMTPELEGAHPPSYIAKPLPVKAQG